MWPSHPAVPGFPFCAQSVLNSSATGARPSAFRPVIPRRYYLADYCCQHCCSLSDSGPAIVLSTSHDQPAGFARPISPVADARPILCQVDTSRETHAHASAQTEAVTHVRSPNLAPRETVITDQTNTSEMSDTVAIDNVGESLNSNDSNNKASEPNSSQLTNRKTTKTGRRHRTTFSLKQLRVMRERFGQNQYISREEATELAKELKVRVSSLLDWFGNQRTRIRYPSRVGRPQRKRFSPEQIRVMSERFKQNRYICREVVAKLANELNIKTQSLRDWFTNERKRTRHLAPTGNPNRTVFSPEQLQVMRERFAQDCYLNREDATKLAEELNVGISSLLIWFVNKRRRGRVAARLASSAGHQRAAECLPKHD